MRGLGNNKAFNRYQELCENQTKLKESLEKEDLSEEEKKKILFDLKSLQKGINKARRKLVGY